MARHATTNERVDAAAILARVRADAGLSQADFAASLGLGLNTYANYERGLREMPFAVAEALWRVYRIDPIAFWDPVAARTFGHALDTDVLETVTEALLRHLEGKPLKPKAFASVVGALYAMRIEFGPMSAEAMRTMVRSVMGAHGRR